MNENDFVQSLTFLVAETQYTDALRLEESAEQLDVVVAVKAIAGTTPVVQVTPQVSLDKTTWVDRSKSKDFGSTGNEELTVMNPLAYTRFKVVLTGTDPTATVEVRAVASEGSNTQSANQFETVTPSDTTQFSKPTRAIYVGVTGDVALESLDGTAVVFKACPAGLFMPVTTLRVKATGTTATNLVALF